MNRTSPYYCRRSVLSLLISALIYALIYAPPGMAAFTTNVIGVVNDETVGNDSNLLIVFYVQIMPDDFVMQLHRF